LLSGEQRSTRLKAIGVLNVDVLLAQAAWRRLPGDASV
jgi:hypothetical protein